jgi:hypothetical protein
MPTLTHAGLFPLSFLVVHHLIKPPCCTCRAIGIFGGLPGVRPAEWADDLPLPMTQHTVPLLAFVCDVANGSD